VAGSSSSVAPLSKKDKRLHENEPSGPIKSGNLTG
jgi:hypothetical protein